ncbi:hypothetical protein HZH66_004605 [Vespula vulgaris]|uniref:Uncharacterized protein n=1 Tax=Vespula vulgaris TaxID=7454 RepID=A0A834K8V1_VESVU|nr:hypothetical protein HZH66_004605 [Vespula vulgaris]
MLVSIRLLLGWSTDSRGFLQGGEVGGTPPTVTESEREVLKNRSIKVFPAFSRITEDHQTPFDVAISVDTKRFRRVDVDSTKGLGVS